MNRSVRKDRVQREGDSRTHRYRCAPRDSKERGVGLGDRSPVHAVLFRTRDVFVSRHPPHRETPPEAENLPRSSQSPLSISRTSYTWFSARFSPSSSSFCSSASRRTRSTASTAESSLLSTKLTSSTPLPTVSRATSRSPPSSPWERSISAGFTSSWRS